MNTSNVVELLLNSSINLPGVTFNDSEGDVGIFFSSYSTPILFPLALEEGMLPNETSDVIDSAVIGATVVQGGNVSSDEVKDLEQPVNITLISSRIQGGNTVSLTVICKINCISHE